MHSFSDVQENQKMKMKMKMMVKEQFLRIFFNHGEIQKTFFGDMEKDFLFGGKGHFFEKTRFVCGSMSNVDHTRTRAAVSEVAAAKQQPEGWRFVPDTILPWVSVGTPVGPGKDTHGTLGADQREGRGWPEHSSAQQYSAETRQTW